MIQCPISVQLQWYSNQLWIFHTHIFFWINKSHLSYIKGICNGQIQINCNERAGLNAEKMDASKMKIKVWCPHLVLPQSPALDGYGLRSQLLTSVPKGSIKKASCQASPFLENSVLVFGTLYMPFLPAWLKPYALLRSMNSSIFLTQSSILRLCCSYLSFHVFAVDLQVLISPVSLKETHTEAQFNVKIPICQGCSGDIC